jgi:hypothetical protein
MSYVDIMITEDAASPFAVDRYTTDKSIIDEVDGMPNEALGDYIYEQRKILRSDVQRYADLTQLLPSQHTLVLQRGIYMQAISNQLVWQFKPGRILSRDFVNKKTVLLGQDVNRYYDLKDWIWVAFDQSEREQQARMSMQHEELHAKAAQTCGYIWSYAINYETIIEDDIASTHVTPEVIVAPPETLTSSYAFCRAMIEICDAPGEEKSGHDISSLRFFNALLESRSFFRTGTGDSYLRALELRDTEHEYAQVLNQILLDPYCEISR